MTTYEAYYMLGKLDKEEGRECNHGNTLPYPHAFTGYIDGYIANRFKEPKSPDLIIKKLKKRGMIFISDNLLKTLNKEDGNV